MFGEFLRIYQFLGFYIYEKGGDFLAKHKKIERVREIERRRQRREKRKKLAAKAGKGPAAAAQA
jgi:hypothetical protein